MSSQSKTSWGTMIAGAAVATGALLLAVSVKPDILSSLGETFANLGSTLKDLGVSMAKSVGGMFSGTSEPMSEGSKRLLTAIGGVAMIGAGRSYMKSQENAQALEAAMAEGQADRMGFADRERMRATQGIMAARMGMAQQMGRA